MMMQHPSTRTRVVIVDDSRTMQAVLEHMLSTMRQFEVVGVAADGASAVDLIKRVKPDLVTIDLMMPYIDGTQLLVALSDVPNLRKVVISGHSSNSLSVVAKLESLGADACVSKAHISRDPNTLSRVLSDVVKRPKSPDQRRPADNQQRSGLEPRYPIPADERDRLKTIDRLSLANDSQDHALDLITSHLALTTSFSSCIITFIDRDKQWVKSGYGFERGSMARSQAICNHTICGDEPFIVEDTSRDSRFSSLDVVLSGSIRSYVGFPIIGTSGVKVGAVCLIDTKPRHVSNGDLQNLRSIAKIAAIIIEERSPPLDCAA